MNFDYELALLSEKFTQDYSVNEYPELMCKEGRPYACLLIETHYDYFICIPFRSSIRHKNSFMFKKSKRSKRTHSGLDYSKIVIVKNTDYINVTSNAIVDNDEYSEMVANIETISNDANKYVERYVKHLMGVEPLHDREYDRNYRFSTLQYFKDILLPQDK